MKKKVLFVIGNLQLGGAETVLVDLLNNIYMNFEIDLLLVNNNGPLIEKLNKKINVKYITKNPERCRNSFSKFYNKAYRSLIYRYLYRFGIFSKFIHNYKLKQKYDVEVAFLPGVPSEIIKRSPNKRSKKIMWVHANVNGSDKKSYLECANSYKYFDKIIGVSQTAIDTFVETFPDSKDKIKLIYNYISIKKIEDNANCKTDNCVFTNDKINVLSVGRLSYVKGFDRIVSIAKKYNSDINFNIIGDGNERSNLDENINCNNVKNMLLLGSKSNPYPYIKQSDVFLLSSRSEAYPTVVIEAMLLKKFIIATDVPGVREILKNYGAKIIVDNSTEGIEKGIRKYLKDRLKYDKIQRDNSDFKKQNDDNLQKVVDLLNEK